MTNKLKPCPFCGGKALLGFSRDEFLNERHFVICENVIECGCLTQYCNNKDNAIKRWNRRAENDR
jgi:Lar family restriction alleviation protein